MAESCRAPRWPQDLRVAVLLPCYNEGAAIGAVVAEFRAALPGAQVYVFDNLSTDDTAAKALAAGARVRPVGLRGKGNVVRRMFADVEADVYVMADGDGTYDAQAAPRMVEQLVTDRLDVVLPAHALVPGLAVTAGAALGLLVNFAMARRLVFRPRAEERRD